MTKAVILSNKGKGLYSARIEYDTDRLEGRIAFIQAAINATDDLIAELEEVLAQVESDRGDAGQALRDAIAAYEQAKIDMELEKDQARLDAAAVRDQAIAAAKGSHDSTVDRVNDDIQEASSERQAAIAAANDDYAMAEAEHQQGLDDADHDFAVCVDSGTEYATCRDTRDEEYERLDAALQDAADRRDEAIASADGTYDSAYDRGQNTIEASEATRDAAIDKAESAYVQTLANIDGDFKALEAPMQAVTEANLEYIKTLQPVQNAESQIGMQEINRLSAEQQLAVLQAAREERIEDVWCADYTLNLQPDDEAGLIWPDIDANKLPIVMPGGRPAEYQARVASERVIGPASSFFNRAIMPILQRIKPRHKIGKVTAVNEDGTLNVELRADLSRFGRVNTVIASGLSSVPVEYMNYGALPFEVGDDVVVRFDGIDQTDPVVIGFEHDPKIAGGFVFGGGGIKTGIIRSGVMSFYDLAIDSLGIANWQGSDGSAIWWDNTSSKFEGSLPSRITTFYRRRPRTPYTIFEQISFIGQSELIIGAAQKDGNVFFVTVQRINEENYIYRSYTKPEAGGEWSKFDEINASFPSGTIPYNGHQAMYIDSEGRSGGNSRVVYNNGKLTKRSAPSLGITPPLFGPSDSEKESNHLIYVHGKNKIEHVSVTQFSIAEKECYRYWAGGTDEDGEKIFYERCLLYRPKGKAEQIRVNGTVVDGGSTSVSSSVWPRGVNPDSGDTMYEGSFSASDVSLSIVEDSLLLNPIMFLYEKIVSSAQGSLYFGATTESTQVSRELYLYNSGDVMKLVDRTSSNKPLSANVKAEHKLINGVWYGIISGNIHGKPDFVALSPNLSTENENIIATSTTIRASV